MKPQNAVWTIRSGRKHHRGALKFCSICSNNGRRLKKARRPRVLLDVEGEAERALRVPLAQGARYVRDREFQEDDR